MDTHALPSVTGHGSGAADPGHPWDCAMEHTRGPEEPFAARPIRRALGHSAAHSHEESHVTMAAKHSHLGSHMRCTLSLNHIHAYSPTHLPSSRTAGHRHTWGF